MTKLPILLLRCYNDVFFEVFRLLKFVNKIGCTEHYLEFHETNDIYENPINQGLIWNLFWYIINMSSREILKILEKTCLMII